jgi:hypothetical protein
MEIEGESEGQTRGLSVESRGVDVILYLPAQFKLTHQRSTDPPCNQSGKQANRQSDSQSFRQAEGEQVRV